MNFEQRLKAIQHIRPNAEFVLRETDLEWLDKNQTEPTEAEIAAGWISYQAKVEAEKIEAESKKIAAQSKLAALGLTVEDLTALGLAQ